MASLFFADPAEAEPKVKHSNFREHYPAVDGNTTWSTLVPYIRQAERKFLFPFICEEYYLELAANEAAGTETPIEAKLIGMIRDALAFYTVHHAMPHLSGLISDMGINQRSSSDGTTAPIPMWRYKNKRWETINDADNMLDGLLEYMQTLADEADSSVDTWVASDCYNEHVSCFFRRTSDLRRCVNIRNSRRTFIKIVPFLVKAEEQHLQTMLCDAQYEDLCTKIESNTLSADELKLVEKCRPIAAHYGMLMALPNLIVVIENDGLKTVSSDDGMNKKDPAAGTAIAQFQSQLKVQAQIAEANLRAFLYTYADTYPLWKDSDCYIDPDSLEACPTNPEHHIGGIIL